MPCTDRAERNHFWIASTVARWSAAACGGGTLRRWRHVARAILERENGVMKTAYVLGTVMTLAVLVGAEGLGWGAAPPVPAVPAAPTTLWNFLGFPQGFQKIRDATTNPLGKHPQWERKPALKRIADVVKKEVQGCCQHG